MWRLEKVGGGIWAMGQICLDRPCLYYQKVCSYTYIYIYIYIYTHTPIDMQGATYTISYLWTVSQLPLSTLKTKSALQLHNMQGSFHDHLPHNLLRRLPQNTLRHIPYDRYEYFPCNCSGYTCAHGGFVTITALKFTPYSVYSPKRL